VLREVGRAARAVCAGAAVPGSTVERVNPVIVLNGGSSSGKTSIARSLQRLLGTTWMTLGVDDLIRALPGGEELDALVRARQDGGAPVGTGGSVEFGPGGSVVVGDDFRRAEASWYAGVAAIGRCGTGLIIDEVFLGGRSSQERLASALEGLPLVWIGVRCSPEVAEARERSRPDRVGGMARLQATRVHQGVVYDLIVDTTAASAADCARAVAAHLSTLGD
jgi:chloramphenicol 3-O phosphotransferase